MIKKMKPSNGVGWLEEYAGKPVVGVFPYLQGLILDAEDRVSFTGPDQPKPGADLILLLDSKSPRTDLEWLKQLDWTGATTASDTCATAAESARNLWGIADAGQDHCGPGWD